jgi:hypothetical protein
MSADSSEQPAVEQQALLALNHLDEEDKSKVLKYIESLITLENAKHDQGSITQDRELC